MTTADWVALSRSIGEALQTGAAERDRTGEIARGAFERLRATGITSALVPAESGGGGATHAEMGAILREIGRHDPSVAVTLAMHSHVLAAQVWRHKHGQDAERLFRKVVDDRALLLSSGASDWVGANGSARKVDGGYRVHARKSPVSGSEVGDILVTSIRWEGAPGGPQVMHCSVPMNADGLTIDRTWDTLGLRATGSHTVVLDDVLVPDAAISLIRPADQWHPIWNTVLGVAMPLIMSAYVGIADAALAAALRITAGRTDGHSLQVLGEMMNAHTVGADMVDAMFREADNLQFANTDDIASRTLSRKTAAAESLIHAVRLAMEAAGGTGYSRTSEIERLYRDVHGSLYHPLPRAKQTQFTGRVMLGLSPV